MSATLEILACGPGTSLQDFGRYGFRRFGVALAGAMDRAALARANLLVGNRVDTCGIEFTLAGGRFRVHDGPVALALGDATARLILDGRAVPAFTSVVVQPGQVVEVSALTAGVYACLAVSGGIAVAEEMVSRSMHRRSGIGGSSLMVGDRLPCDAPDRPRALRAPPQRNVEADGAPVRIIRGPQDDLFPAGAFARLLAEPYHVDPRSDRMGCRLAGARLISEPIGGMVSDGVVPGSIQVPGEGLPIVLMRDCQTTGGYPKIATVISADIDRLAQVRPGESLRFVEVTLPEALAALRAAVADLAGFAASLASADAMPDSAALLAMTLVGGVVHAGDDGTWEP